MAALRAAGNLFEKAKQHLWAWLGKDWNKVVEAKINPASHWPQELKDGLAEDVEDGGFLILATTAVKKHKGDMVEISAIGADQKNEKRVRASLCGLIIAAMLERLPLQTSADVITCPGG